MLRSLKVFSLVLAALALGMHFAHLLELGPKLEWDAALYFPVQGTLYRYFGTVGPVLEVGALLLIALLTLVLGTRKQRYGFPLISASLIVLALIVWVAAVLPANAALAQGPVTGWQVFRLQWQVGQSVIFGFHLTGFTFLTVAVTRSGG